MGARRGPQPKRERDEGEGAPPKRVRPPQPRRGPRPARMPPPGPGDPAGGLRMHALTDEQVRQLTELMGARVYQARQELGLTQMELASAFGRSQPWCREVESAKQRPPHHVLLGLARATGRSVAWFYGESDRRDGMPG